MNGQVTHPPLDLKDVVEVIQNLQRIVQAFKVHSERMVNEYLQTFTPRYLINAVYNEATSELAHEYQLISRLITEFPVYVQDSLNAIYKRTVELLVSDQYQPADIVALATLFRETVSLILVGIYALLMMSDALVASNYQQGLMKRLNRPIEERMKYEVIHVPLKKKGSIEDFKSRDGENNGETPDG
ncbi:MAG: hypothetical protein QW687_00200 [Candidatus Hadarchaeales archaeon]